MPIIVTLGAGSAKSFGAFRTSLGGVNFLEVRTVTSSSLQYNSSFVDSAYNIYVTGYNAAAYIPIEKINSTGVTTSFSNRVTGGTINYCCQSFSSISSCVDVDSSGNIYVGGTAGDTGRGTVQAYDSSGNLLWQKYIYPGSDYTYVTCVAGIKYNPVNCYVYVVMQIGSSGSFLFAALNASNGGLVYNKKMSGYVGYSDTNGYYSVSNNMAVDSSGNVYVCYAGSTVYAGDNVGYLKIDTSFNILQFPVVTGLVANSYYAQCIALDSSGNVYVGTCGSSGYLKACVIKFDSSGTYLWNATASLASTSLGFQAITTDSSGNVYCGGGGAGGSLGANSYILKFDSDEAGIML
jgi:outer membrane protein assembly factor BamB